MLIKTEVFQIWNQINQSNYGRLRLFNNLAITIALMVKCVFLRSLQGLPRFINVVFKFAQLPLSCPYDLCICKRAKTVNVALKTKTKEITQCVAINFTELRVYGES
ncbi:Mobile element protein (plasmid) [Candidatus Enterovibrio altilux]|uniref:Mobile element protein n=1 Tax=Candidatus Enterovibrio altilux TaxID=1927128 RepID=A0A291BAT0_9GAMM|nr:Mobile element protein [Candidatus Enterovibrio luxaltus]